VALAAGDTEHRPAGDFGTQRAGGDGDDLAACEDGQKLRVDVSLTQGDVSARGVGSGKCSGGLGRFPVKVSAHGHKHGFDEGRAEVTAVALIHGHGRVADTQEWTRQVEIVTQNIDQGI